MQVLCAAKLTWGARTAQNERPTVGCTVPAPGKVNSVISCRSAYFKPMKPLDVSGASTGQQLPTPMPLKLKAPSSQNKYNQ